MKRIVSVIFLSSISFLPSLSQSIKYNGDIDVGIVSTRKFTDYGFYCYPSAGVKMALNQKYALYLKLGYTYQSATFYYGYGVSGQWLQGSRHHNAGGVSATLGFTFQ